MTPRTVIPLALSRSGTSARPSSNRSRRAPLREVAAKEPEAPDRHADADPGRPVRLIRLVERAEQVIVLRLQSLQRGLLPAPEQLWLDPLRESDLAAQLTIAHYSALSLNCR
jgi:hypothetical protein